MNMKPSNTFYILLIISFLFLYFSMEIKAQSKTAIPVYNFQQIEPIFHPSRNNDTTYIFNFWATYCAPCIKELPYFEQIGKEFSDKKLKIVLISLDLKSQIEKGVIPFIKKREIQSKVIVLSDPDANSWIDRIDPSWNGVIPATLFVKGDNREFYEKSFEYDELRLLTIKFLDK